MGLVNWLARNAVKGANLRQFLGDISPNPEILSFVIVAVFVFFPSDFFDLTTAQLVIIRYFLMVGALIGGLPIIKLAITGKIP